MKNIFQSILVPLLVCLVASLVLAEVSVRILGQRLNTPSYWSFKYADLLAPVKDSQGWSLHRPNLNTKFYGKVFRTNSLGLRSEPIDSTFPKQVLWIGSSVALGWGVDEGERITDYFNQRSPDYRFINAGIAGHRMTDHLQTLKFLLGQIEVKGVVLFFHPNDLLPPAARLPEFVKPSLVLSIAVSWLQSVFRDEKKDSTYSADQVLREIRDLCVQKRIPFRIILPPDLSVNKVSFTAEELVTRFTQAGISVLNVTWDQIPGGENPKKFWINVWDPHGNPSYQKSVYEELHRRQIKFDQLN